MTSLSGRIELLRHGTRPCWACWNQVDKLTWKSPWNCRRRLWGSLRRSSFPHPPLGSIPSPICWTPEGQERPAEVGGGRDRVVHLILEENLISLCSERSSQGLAGETRRDGPWRCSHRHEKEQCSPSGKEMVSTKEGWLSQQHTGENAVKKGSFQDWLSCHLVTNFSNSHQFHEGSTCVLNSPFA